MGRETNIEAWFNLRPTSRLLLRQTFERLESHDLNTGAEFFSGYLARARISYQVSRELSLRLVNEYNDFSKNWSIDPLLTYRINPFSTFFLGATYDYDRYTPNDSPADKYVTKLGTRQFFMKIQYLLQA